MANTNTANTANTGTIALEAQLFLAIKSFQNSGCNFNSYDYEMVYATGEKMIKYTLRYFGSITSQLTAVNYQQDDIITIIATKLLYTHIDKLYILETPLDLKRYLTRAVKNTSFDLLKGQARHNHVDISEMEFSLTDEHSNFEKQLEINDEVNQLINVLAKFDETAIYNLLGTLYLGLSKKELAEIFNNKSTKVLKNLVNQMLLQHVGVQLTSQITNDVKSTYTPQQLSKVQDRTKKKIKKIYEAKKMN